MDTRNIAKKSFTQSSMAALVTVLILILIYNGRLILTLFGGMLIGVFFYSSARWLGAKTHSPVKAWLPVTIIAPFLLLGLFTVYTAPKIAAQGSELADRLPQAVEYVESHFTKLPWAGEIEKQAEKINNLLPKGSTILDTITGFLSSAVDGFGSFTLALFLGIFLAVNPHGYINGALKLVPPAHRQKSRKILENCGSTLAGWLIAKTASMLIVGVLTTAGLWLLGIDLALILGLLAALLSFIPNIGPVIAFVPAAMVSITSGTDALLYVSGLYIGVQAIESYVITPFLQAEIVDLPPALTLATQVILAAMTGMTGIVLAAPLTAALMVIIKMWYVEGLLEDREPAAH